MEESISESWRPVVGFEGAYEVSDLGRIRSLDRMVSGLSGTLRLRPGHVRTPWADAKGYLVVDFYADNRKRRRFVHQAVLEAFVGPAPEGMECCHRDDNPANNALTNLRWGTRSDNKSDRLRNGRDHEATKTRCPRGHALFPPNLIPANLRRGQRACLACSRAQSAVWRIRNSGRPVPDMQEVSDRYYGRIMGTQPS